MKRHTTLGRPGLGLGGQGGGAGVLFLCTVSILSQVVLSGERIERQGYDNVLPGEGCSVITLHIKYILTVRTGPGVR